MSIDPLLQIERLLQYGCQKGLLAQLDVIEARNSLLDLLELDEPYAGAVMAEQLNSADDILGRLVGYAAGKGLLAGDEPEYRALFDNRIMGCLMPRPSEVAGRFGMIAGEQGIRAATDWFYQLCLDSNYIRMAEIRKNVSWKTDTAYGAMEITINLTKPEKDPRQIAMDSRKPRSGYPACQLCAENVGYAGRYDFPARQTLRLIPVTINREPWYFQYSPYVYFQEHCIVLSERHEPMKMDGGTFEGLLDFIGQFPHYFCGSNTELPITGGSILSHEHFQGGRHVFPIHGAAAIRRFRWTCDPEPGIEILRWPLSTIRLTSTSRAKLAALAGHILQSWRGYNDPDAGILAQSTEAAGHDPLPHNTVTPIARFSPDGRYELTIILRNNRTSKEYPDGVFHPHPEIHPIKKENIGLIEAMGLAILPGRLKRDMAVIQSVLEGRMPIQSALDTIDLSLPGLSAHAGWIRGIIEKNGCRCTSEEATAVLQDAIGRRFTEGLEHCGVFKQDDAGIRSFIKFMTSAGCQIE
jgi:UDPglucose--hexose-1-phosphate uridylyltransferase